MQEGLGVNVIEGCGRIYMKNQTKNLYWFRLRSVNAKVLARNKIHFRWFRWKFVNEGVASGVGWGVRVKGRQERCQLNPKLASAGGTRGQNVAPGHNESWGSDARGRKFIPEWNPGRKEGRNAGMTISCSPQVSYWCFSLAESNPEPVSKDA